MYGMRWLGILLAVLAGTTARAQDKPAATWKAGVAKIVITPDKLMWMSGYVGTPGRGNRVGSPGHLSFAQLRLPALRCPSEG